MSSPEFRYVTTNLLQTGSTPNPIISELPFTGVNYTQQLNSNGTFQGHVLLSGIGASRFNAYEGTIPGKTILWVLYSDGVTNTSIPVWSGVIWAREYDSASQTLMISAQEMMSLYQHRRISTTKDYSTGSGFDPAYIAYQLMQYAEGLDNGKTGLTYNYLTTALLTKKVYYGYELKSVYQAVKDLSASYYDFKISPLIDVNDRLINQFTLGNPLGALYSPSDPLGIVFQFPGNLVEYKFPEDASTATNKLYGLGYGDNNTRLGAIAIDTQRIGNYTITNAVGSGTQITFTSTNKFFAGQNVIVTGVNPTQYNGTYIIDSVQTSGPNKISFKVLSTKTGTYVSGGKAQGDWPLLEDTANYTDIGSYELLSEVTLGQLNATSYPPTTVEVVIPPYIDPIYPSYQIGQQVQLRITDDFFPSTTSPYYETMRIVAISVSPGEDGPSRVTLTLTRLLATGSVS